MKYNTCNLIPDKVWIVFHIKDYMTVECVVLYVFTCLFLSISSCIFCYVANQITSVLRLNYFPIADHENSTCLINLISGNFEIVIMHFSSFYYVINRMIKDFENFCLPWISLTLILLTLFCFIYYRFGKCVSGIEVVAVIKKAENGNFRGKTIQSLECRQANKESYHSSKSRWIY